MPNIQSMILNGPINLVEVTYSDHDPLIITRQEAQDWIDSRPNASDAQIERQIQNLAEARWVGRTDSVAVHLFARSPVVISVYLAQAGDAIPPNWWL